MKFVVLILFLLTHTLFGQTKNSFRETDYPKNKFTTKKERQVLGSITVDIIQTSPIAKNDSKQFSCRTWLRIKNGGNLIKEQFEDIEPVGGCYGLYFPEQQPSENLILVSKFGDYAGRVYTISSKGEFSDYPGGSFYVSSDKKYLFSSYDSDLSGVTIIDIKEDKMIFSGELDKYLSDWYFNEGKYFGVIFEDSKDSNKKLTFDLKTKKFVEGRLTEMDKKNKLRLYNDPTNKKCNCGS